MIPSVLAQQIRQGLEDYLQATFPITTPFFYDLLRRFMREPGNLLKGPYLSLQLPFRRGNRGGDFFPDVPLPYPLYLHQEKAFQRLSAATPQPTIVATGTGSGKTECFLIPLLNYCCQHRGEPGIKAILIYPMNALANDQAIRLARTIFDNPKLNGQVTAGLYIGQREEDPAKVMTRDRIITDRDLIRKQPPDILLTNYKMLDYLLIRPQDTPLWAHQKPETLRFLVVDELHTFDGAQGTDLACLVRRLKERLKCPENYLCPIGTSATLGDASSAQQLLTYAANIFGEPFPHDAIISEDRLSPGEFLEDALIEQVEIPGPETLPHLLHQPGETPEAYGKRQAALWFPAPSPDSIVQGSSWLCHLSERLRGHLFFQNFLKIVRDRIASFDEILEQIHRYLPNPTATDGDYAIAILNSLLAMISTGKRAATSAGGAVVPGRTEPFLQVRLHLWARELKRLVAEVAVPSLLRFQDDLKEEERKHHLPVVHCRECGATGWIGLTTRFDAHLKDAPKDLYQQYFQRSTSVAFLFPQMGSAGEEIPRANLFRLCPACLYLGGDNGSDKPCPSCGEAKLILVYRPDPETMIHGQGRERGRFDCPYCQGSNSFSIIGAQAATMTSTMISQLFSSSFNDDRKLLTFSDSVQDAAHRAGFFGARTWQFNFRAALLQAVEAGGEDIPLANLAEIFQAHWGKTLSPETFVAMFLPPGLLWFRDFEALKRDDALPRNSRLPYFLERRLNWEITSEFGFNARIGRSLERQEAALAFPEISKLQKAAEELGVFLKNEIGGFSELPAKILCRYLLGVCDHIRHLGGILHAELDGFVREGTNTFYFYRQKPRIMPQWGSTTRAPSFPGENAGKRYVPIVKAQGRGTWFQQWVERSLGALNPLIGGAADQALRLTFKALCEHGILEERPASGGRVWGLNPAKLLVTTKVTGFTCSRCGHRRTGAAGLAMIIQSSPCLRSGCLGQYSPRDSLPDYYADLYRTAVLTRIMAQEHTGLLSRDEREEIERLFKQSDRDRKPWHPNLLSCTPTLEMGIDIGDLSSLTLCSVPPAKANFVQRVGRAGRRDGNSLCLTIANAKPHDLYFYAEPSEMLLGQVDPPGVFLGASAVLERQLTAWCFDRWVETGLPISAIPPRIGTVLNQIDATLPDKFPKNFLDFLTRRQTELCESFFRRFAKELSPESREYLHVFALGDQSMEGSLSWKILHALQVKKKERDSLARRVKQLQDRIKKKKDDPAQDRNAENEMAEMHAEQDGLGALLKRINTRDTLNFFTDEGLLPNYAFPEAGVTLHSIIYRRTEMTENEGKKYEYRTQEFERSAGSALSELAPNSEFFGGGRHVKIDQVDMAISEIETWRLCSQCAYMELLGAGEEKKTCPRCSDVMWADEGRKHQLLRLRQVIATTEDSSSRIGDDQDDRPITFFQRKTSIDSSPSDILAAWAVEDRSFPFGYEFLKKAMFREVNLGETDSQAPVVRIRGAELSVKGFTLCRSCGKVQLNQKEEIRHSLTCTSRQQEDPACLTDCVYLYREFSSEALRILLPLGDTPFTEKQMESFLAAFHMGLKLKFSGNIDHLQATLTDEPVPDSAYRRKYVVLYDSVPGGTGYLKQLIDGPQALMEVFDLALKRLRSCACLSDPLKDGCYRCLFKYRGGFKLEKLSRDMAIEFLARILQERENIKPIENLKQVSIDSLADSPLEEMFLEALRRRTPTEPEVHLRKEVVNGKPGYHYRIDNQSWLIEMHASLGPKHGVSHACETDFLLYPERTTEGLLPIAVFTDGLAFHHNRLDIDFAQRRSLLASGKYRVWSLTYQDVEAVLSPKPAPSMNFLDPVGWPAGGKWLGFLNGYGLQGMQKVPHEGSLALLKRYLATPDSDTWRRFAFAHSLLWLDPEESQKGTGKAKITGWVQQSWPPDLALGLPSEAISGLRAFGEPGQEMVSLFSALTPKEIQHGREDGFGTSRVLALLRDFSRESEEAWKPFWGGFLRLFNVLQFLPKARFATAKTLERFPEGAWAWDEGLPQHGPSPEWQEACALVLPENVPLARKLAGLGVPAPEVGFELVDEQGTVLAQAEMAWPRKRVAIVEEADGEALHFERAGWSYMNIEQARQDSSQIVSWLQTKENV